MNDLIQILSAMGRGRLAVIGLVAVGLIFFFAYLTSQMTSPQLSLMYSDLQPQDSSEIVGRLGALGVPYEIAENGGAIMVPSKQVAQLRMSMAAEGIPSGGSVGYEIFDRSDSLGTTSFVQNINHLRALEGELSRTIRSLQGVTSARVHLVLPRRELFNRDRRKPSASIILSLSGNAIDNNQVLAIQHLVAAAVPELTPQKVSIVDNRGALLAAGNDRDAADAPFVSVADKTTTFENRLSRQVEDLLGRTVGFGNVRAEVTAELDYDRITTNSESYDPDGQVVRSSQTVEEQGLDQEGGAEAVSVAANLPQAEGTEGGASNTSTNTRTEETVNYEISRTTKTEVREIGRVIRLSVAVLVNGLYQNQDGDRVYVPRQQDEMDKFTALVRTAVGFNEGRGDRVEVVNMRFPDPGAEPEAEIPAFLGLKKADYFRIAEIGVLAIVSLLVILLVARPLVARLLAAAPDAASSVATAVGQIAAATKTQGAIAGPTGDGATAQLSPDQEMTPAAAAAQAAARAAGNEFETMLDLANIENQAKVQSMQKVGELVQDNPNEAVTIIRSWLHGT